MGISVEEKGFRNTAVSDVVRIARTLVELPRPDGAGNRGQGADGQLGADAAVIIVGGLRELTVGALERRRRIDELRANAATIVKAIIAATMGDASRDSQ